eukprot:1141535-Pelagomonas_calceolata.AAC.7
MRLATHQADEELNYKACLHPSETILTNKAGDSLSRWGARAAAGSQTLLCGSVWRGTQTHQQRPPCKGMALQESWSAHHKRHSQRLQHV